MGVIYSCTEGRCLPSRHAKRTFMQSYNIFLYFGAQIVCFSYLFRNFATIMKLYASNAFQFDIYERKQ